VKEKKWDGATSSAEGSPAQRYKLFMKLVWQTFNSITQTGRVPDAHLHRAAPSSSYIRLTFHPPRTSPTTFHV